MILCRALVSPRLQNSAKSDILEMIYAFLVGKMKRVWGYTLFWMGIGMLIMFFVGGGLLGVLLIAGTMLVSYLLFSC